MSITKPSIILIRETDAQMTGSGCCGKLEGDNTKFCGNPVFAETRKIKEDMGEILQALNEHFGDAVEITVVDPRNQLYLYPKILKDIWKYRPSFKSALKGIFMMISVPSIIINGEICYNRTLPKVQEIVESVTNSIQQNGNNKIIIEKEKKVHEEKAAV
ncbi:MAG: hypothetical protein ACE5JB_02985 [bacterium]